MAPTVQLPVVAAGLALWMTAAASSSSREPEWPEIWPARTPRRASDRTWREARLADVVVPELPEYEAVELAMSIPCTNDTDCLTACIAAGSTCPVDPASLYCSGGTCAMTSNSTSGGCISYAGDWNPTLSSMTLAPDQDAETPHTSLGNWSESSYVEAVLEGVRAAQKFLGKVSPFEMIYFIAPGGVGDAEYQAALDELVNLTGSDSSNPIMQYNDLVDKSKAESDAGQAGLWAVEEDLKCTVGCARAFQMAFLGFYPGYGYESRIQQNGNSDNLELGVHEYTHVFQASIGQVPTWLWEGGANHVACLLADYLQSYDQGVYSSRYHACMAGELNQCQEAFVLYPNMSLADCENSISPEYDDRDATILGAQSQLSNTLCYSTGMWATAYAIHVANGSSTAFWQAETIQDGGFWRAVAPSAEGWAADPARYGVVDGFDYTQTATWVTSLLEYTNIGSIEEFYSQFDDWMRTTNQTIQMAILDDGIGTVFDSYSASQGKLNHSQCSVETVAPTASPSDSPTTEAPTTQAPTTEAPTAEAPTTEAPTTEAPTTEAPTTEAPTTEAPTTEAPTTESPTNAPSFSPSNSPSATPFAPKIIVKKKLVDEHLNPSI